MEERRSAYLSYVKGQIDYNNRKSGRAKKRYLISTIAALCLNAVIPVLSCFSSTTSPYKAVIAAISAASTLLTGIALTMNFQNDWMNCRSACQGLEAEVRGYEAGCGEYASLGEEEAFRKLYGNCEEILSNDRQTWKNSLEGKKA